MEHTYDFDLAVIGSGPGGQKAAIMAAKLGHRVCVIDSKAMVGGVCVNTGTIPSKTLREAVLYLTGMQMRDLYGASYRVKEEITISDLLARLQHVVGRETEVIRSQLLRNHIELIPGMATFIDPHTLSVDIEGQQVHRTLTADKVVIATGTVPARPSNVDFDGKRILDSDQILELETRSELTDRGGGRRDRGGVRLDVRRAGHPGHPGREAAADAGLLRSRDRRVAQVPPTRPRDVLPLRRGGRIGGELRTRHDHHARLGEEDRRRGGDVLGRAGRATPGT